MAAMPIEWHEECLVNMADSAKQAFEEYTRARERWRRVESDTSKLRRQIARAKRLGKTRFDAERFRDTD